MAKSFHPIFDIIDGASADFDKVVEASEKKILQETLSLIKGLETDAHGNIKTTISNLKKIGVIKTRLTKIANNKQFLAGVAKLIGAFDKIYNEQKKYFDSLSSNFVAHTNYHMGASSKFELMKSIAAQNVANNLTGAGLSANVTGKISDMLLRAVTTGAKYSDIVSEMHAYLLSTETSQGALSKYAKTYAVTALGQYTGQNNKLVTDDLGCEWFMYTGSTIETTREFCAHMTKKKYIHISEFADILAGKIDGHECAIYDKTGLPYGLIEGTTPENFLVNVGGWNCRHQLVPIAKEMVPAEIRAKFEKPKQPTKEEIEAQKKAEEEAKLKALQEQQKQQAIQDAQDIIKKMGAIPAADSLKQAIKVGDAKTIQAETIKLYQLEKQLQDLVHIADVMEEAKTHTYEELKMVNDAVEAKMQQWKGLPIDQLQKKLKFEAIDFLGGNMKGVQDKYPTTWKLSQKAYLKQLDIVQKQAAIDAVKKQLAPIQAWSDAHPKSTKVAGLLADAELAINLGEDIAIIQQKASLAIKEQHKRMQEQARRDKGKGELTFAELTDDVEEKLLQNYKSNTVGSVDKVLRKVTEDVWATLTNEEKIVLTKYTQTYSYLNETLRGISYIGGRSKAEYEHDLPILTKALSKFKVPQNMIVRRGTTGFHIQELGKDLSQVQVGDVFTDKAFLSTAAHREKGFFRTFNLVITVPKGAQGAFAEPFSHFTDYRKFDYNGTLWDGKSKETIEDEFEWIGQRGCQFKVTKVQGGTIYLRLIGQLK